MAPSFTRVTAGACLLLTGLFAGSSAVALANPDTQDDNGSTSQSANPSPARKSKPAGSIGSTSGQAGKVTASSTGKTLPNRHSSSLSSPDGSSSDTSATESTKGPSANAVANLPGAATAVQAADSVAGSVRQVLPTAASTVPSATPGAMVPVTVPGGVTQAAPLAGVLAPIGNLVESVANALGTGQIIQPIMDVANHLVELSAPVASDVTTRDSRTVHLPTGLPVPNVNAALDAPQPVAVAPSPSLFGINSSTSAHAVAPAPMSPTVMTPQLLSTEANFAASHPSNVSPATPPVAHGWMSGIATQILHGVREALRNVTLTELALAALPGVAGLLFFFATGIGLGHRQAKFGFVMATSGSLRFAVRGPLGVVRSGSVVEVHSRKKARAAEKALAAQAVETPAKDRRHLRAVDSAA